MQIHWNTTIQAYMATEPRTDLRLMKLNKDHKMALPGEEVVYTEEIRVPVTHVLAVDSNLDRCVAIGEARSTRTPI